MKYKKNNLPTNLNMCHIKTQSNVHNVISVSLDPCHLPAFNRKCICMHVSTSGTFSCKNNTTTNKVPARKKPNIYICSIYPSSISQIFACEKANPNCTSNLYTQQAMQDIACSFSRACSWEQLLYSS